MNLMLAQSTDLPSVPSDMLKWVVVILVAIILVTCAIIVAWSSWSAAHKPARQRLDDNPPIEVRKAQKRYNHDHIESRFGEVENRLDGHDEQIEAIKTDGQQKQNRLMFALGRIAQKLDVEIDLND